MNASICNSTLTFSFITKEQTDRFIRLFLKDYPYADNLYFEKKIDYNERGKETVTYNVTIENIHWAHNLIKIGKIIRKCDFKETT